MISYHSVTIYKNKQLMEIRKMTGIARIRELYDMALTFTIERKRDVVTFDLIKFSKENNFHLFITQYELRTLINS
jgi:hypothetical protein